MAIEDLTGDVHMTPDALSALVQLAGFGFFLIKMYNGPHSRKNKIKHSLKSNKKISITLRIFKKRLMLQPEDA